MGGLRLEVLTSQFSDEVPKAVTLVMVKGEPFEHGPFDPSIHAPAVVIGERCGLPVAWLAEQQTPGEWQPAEKPDCVGPMMSGAFVYTSDSRFHEAVGPAPVPLHSRWETPTQYASYD